MSKIANTPELVKSDQRVLPTFVTTLQSDFSFVKSVRPDFQDVSPYYAKKDKDLLTRMEYSQVELCKQTSGIKLQRWSCFVTKFELLNCPPIKYPCFISCSNAVRSQPISLGLII